MLKKASITGYLRLFLAFLKGKRASQMGRLFFTNSLSKNDSITWAIMLVLFSSKKHKK
ncbi:MAG: hypothetical protein ACI9XO_003954 [Paraglaciecola sp.]|jgi:hypothetical protein